MILINKKMGRLLALEPNGFYVSPGGQKEVKWRCLCDCGNYVTVRKSKLLNKTRPTQSCGCINIERLKNNHPAIKHGESKTLLYGIWHGIKDRTLHAYGNKNKSYISKEIKVCQEWRDSYEVFRDWALSNGYKQGLSIDRIDCSGDYEPSNCRFVGYSVQANNKSNNRLITAFGETKTLALWLKDERCKIGRESLRTRINSGWDLAKAISTPPTKQFKGNGTT